jgi:hypothetical protein
MITYKLLSFLGRCDEKLSAKLVSIINKTLPIPDVNCSAALKDYLHCVADMLLVTETTSPQIS